MFNNLNQRLPMQRAYGGFTRTDYFMATVAGATVINFGQPLNLNIANPVLIVKNGVVLHLGSDFTITANAANLTVTTLIGDKFIVSATSLAPAMYPAKLFFIVDPVALSIYNKLVIAQGGDGAYWDMHEASGATRLDKANSLSPAAPDTGTVGTATGPRGGGDVAANFGGAASLAAASTSHIQVPALFSGTSFCLFGWANVSATGTSQVVAGKYSGGGSTTMEYQISYQGGVVNGFNGSGAFYDATVAFPSTGAWHFYCLWRDGSDNKARLNIDGGTAGVSAASDPGPLTVPLQFGLVAGYSYLVGSLSRWGYIKNNFLSGTEITWLINSGAGRDWAEIKGLAGF